MWLEIEPYLRAVGLCLKKIFGGAVPKQYPSGRRVFGKPCRRSVGRLSGGRYKSHSSGRFLPSSRLFEMAFKIAASLAFKGAEEAGRFFWSPL